jgi:bla regulator protein blaR1
MISDYIFGFANHLWQSTLFAFAAWLIILTLRKNRAAVRHRLWLAASIKFLIPFSLLAVIGVHFQRRTVSAAPPLPFSMMVETISGPFSASVPSAVSAEPTSAQQASRFPLVLAGIWICGVAASMFRWFIGWRQVRRAVGLAAPSNLDAPVPVLFGPERLEPGVFGVFNPVLLLPESVGRHLSQEHMEAVLAHELCHVRRRDNLAMAIHMVVESLFWFHPLVWLIRLRLLEEQELACDEEVLRLGVEPARYAESLLKVCEFYLEPPLTCVSGISGTDLKKRVGRIMQNHIGKNLNGWRKLALTAAGVAAMAAPVVAGMMTAQTHSRPADTPKWEAVSVKPCGPAAVGPGQRGQGGGPPLSFSADRMTLRCMNVMRLIKSAYKTYFDEPNMPGPPAIEEVLLGGRPQKTPVEGGPGWVDSELYSIEAKAERAVGREMMQGPMLQLILEDRFQLKVRWDTGERPLYALTVAKGGAKLKPSKEGSCTPMPWPDSSGPPSLPPQLPPGQKYCSWGGGVRGPNATNVVLDAEGGTMDQFSKSLLNLFVDRWIDNRTSITGKFDFHLEYAMPDEFRQRYAERNGRVLSEIPSTPTIFDALQEQLGLKLESTKGPTEILVIDRIERPSPN